jgi:drug/metabolite transporter (DMT)-like permease
VERRDRRLLAAVLGGGRGEHAADLADQRSYLQRLVWTRLAVTGEMSGFSVSSVTAVSWAAFAHLTLLGSVVAFTCYVWLLDHAPAPLVATYTFVIAVALGWAVLAERPSVLTLIGAALVISSVAAVWRVSNLSNE